MFVVVVFSAFLDLTGGESFGGGRSLVESGWSG